MKNSISCGAVLLALVWCLQAIALPRGEDVISVPAVGNGLCVHNLFQTNMVVQRDKPVRVWGWAAPGESVTVSFAGQRLNATAAADRAWSVTLQPMPASTAPQTMTIAGKNQTLTLENLLIGDVWVLGGQSNMEHPLARVEEGDLEIASANNPQLRLLTVPQGSTQEQLPGFARLHEWSGWWKRHFRKGDWDVSSPAVAREFSAIGYVFARRLQDASQVPVGVIDASRGGTTVETWTPTAILRQIDTPEVNAMLAEWDEKIAAYDPQEDLRKRITNHENWLARQTKEGKEIPSDRKDAPSDLRPGPKADVNRYGNCFGGMISPLADFAVKGAIWHQGFNNAFRENGHRLYDQVFPEMIAAWRDAFGDPEMPFGIISLCTAGKPQTGENYLESMVDEGIFIRAVQYETFRKLTAAGDKNIGFASSYDMRRSWYHPGKKVPVGERIARWALTTQYGVSLGWEPPRIIAVKPEDGRLLLTFDGPIGVDKDEAMEGFAVAGDDRQYQPAVIEHLMTGRDGRNRPQYDRKVIVLSSPHVENPKYYRYAWGRNPMGNLIATGRRTPVATQRNDPWLITEMPDGIDPELDHKAKMNEARKRLRAADLARRVADAKAFLADQRDGE